MCARASKDGWPDAAGAAAQAASLRRRAAPLAERDVDAYVAALDALAAPRGATPEDRDAALGDALSHAADVPLAIAETAADTAVLAATITERGDERVRGDAAAAATLAAAAAQASANLVAINLAAAADDPRLTRARAIAAAAVDAARWTLDLDRVS
jgi:formiminotetrahydrofolate cyclodeaminase